MHTWFATVADPRIAVAVPLIGVQVIIRFSGVNVMATLFGRFVITDVILVIGGLAWMSLYEPFEFSCSMIWF